jgi:curved DNA-binding protein
VNYYDALEIKKDASESEIKRSYRKLVKMHHPDKGGSESKFKEISEAYNTLSDPSKKQEYDLRFKYSKRASFESTFNNFNGDFSQMFDDAFNQSAKGRDITIRIKLTLEEVYHGTTKYIDTGSNQFNIKIPKGIHEGAKLKIKGKGLEHSLNSSAPNGDVILIMHILPDPDIIVTNGDVWVDLSLPFYDMILGGSFEVSTKIHKVKINVPKNSNPDKVLRIVGKGFPIYNTDQYGNMMVKLRSSNFDLNKEQLKHVQKIKDLKNE